jgi:hypothetical protein
VECVSHVRTSGSPASGSPVSGLTSTRGLAKGRQVVVGHTLYRPRRAAVPQTFVAENASRCAVCVPGGVPVFRGGVSALLSPKGTRGGVRSQSRCGLTSTFLRPLAPRALPRFLATMDALTPARPALRMGALEHRSTAEQVSRIHLHPTFRAFRLQPPGASGHRFITLPLSVADFRGSQGPRSGLRPTLLGFALH